MPTHPKHTFRLETENHYAYIDLPLQNHTELASFLPDLIREIEDVTGYRVMTVDETDEHGLVTTIYRTTDRSPLPADAHLDTKLRIGVTYGCLPVSLIIPSGAEGKSYADRFVELLKRRFLDRMRRPIRQVHIVTGTTQLRPNMQFKRRQHPSYARPHSESKGTPIEARLRDALTEAGVEFTEQERVVLDNRLFTVPDFLIRAPLLAIYCDGTEFHLDAQKVIRDKQQDRILQRLGFRVFRFSGSEITADARSCAREVVEFVRILGSPQPG